MCFFVVNCSVLERASSQMSYLGAFLKETTAGSVESDDADIEDNRAPSIASSKSNLSEISIVSFFPQLIDIIACFQPWRTFFSAVTLHNVTVFLHTPF